MKIETDRLKIVDVSSLDSFYIISYKPLVKPIGFFGLTKGNEIIGLYIDEKYRSMGVATEVIEELRKRVGKLIVVTSFSNDSMKHVLDKLEFKKYIKYES